MALGVFVTLASPSLSNSRSHASRELDTVIQIKRDFAAASVERGVKKSFLEYVAPDGVIFRPAPVAAVTTIQMDPDDDKGATLDWWPSMGAIARSADLALRVGPWVYNNPNAKGPNARQFHGYYATVWRKQSDGSRQFVIDGAGTRLSIPPQRTRTGSVSRLPISSSPPISASSALRQVRNLEQALSAASQKDNTQAIAPFLTEEAWLMGSGVEPWPNPLGRSIELSRQPAQLRYTHVNWGASQAGDFVYTYGSVESVKPAATFKGGTYLRAWQRTRTGWHVIFQGIKKNT